MWHYVVVEFEVGGRVYQEALDGTVTRYLDVDGNELFTTPPVGDLCAVVDPEPARLPWMR